MGLMKAIAKGAFNGFIKGISTNKNLKDEDKVKILITLLLINEVRRIGRRA